MSIIHRGTGCALYFGTALLAWWLIAIAAGGSTFDFAQSIFGSWLGLVVLFGYTWALLHHMIGGIRHLVWDTGRGLGKASAVSLAVATLASSTTLTVAVWVITCVLRG